MITHLKISNYALIEKLEIDFIPGFITITGETGAGKSILMGALSLILGQRADTSVLFQKDQKCIVEVEFKLERFYEAFFKENDLDFEPFTLIRREILPGGKTRAFINDTPVNLVILKELGGQLVDIHSQHQNLQLNDHVYQLTVVDYVSSNEQVLKQYTKVYSEYQLKVNEIANLRAEINRTGKELDFYQFQYDELNNAKLTRGEKEELENEVNQLEHIEEIKLSLSQTSDLLFNEQSILDQLNEAVQLQKRIKDMYPASVEFSNRLESSYIELKDVASEMYQMADKMEYDPERLQSVKERIDLIYSLLQKYKCREIDELVALKDNLNEKIEAITFSDENLDKLHEESLKLRSELDELAEKLHISRKKTAVFIEKEIAGQLMELGIPNAYFKVVVDRKEEPDKFGKDEIKFLFSANKQAPPEDISKVASGGEMSRLMLSLKSLLFDYKGLPTLIFDEIDSGVSGEIAEKMGSIMKKMALGRQVIAITHLPQVAAQGNEHFLVFKEDEQHATVTRLKKLSSNERVNEIAKLLSGQRVTDAAISNARELLQMSG